MGDEFRLRAPATCTVKLKLTVVTVMSGRQLHVAYNEVVSNHFLSSQHYHYKP